jgi:hypothetical protein
LAKKPPKKSRKMGTLGLLSICSHTPYVLQPIHILVGSTGNLGQCPQVDVSPSLSLFSAGIQSLKQRRRQSRNGCAIFKGNNRKPCHEGTDFHTGRCPLLVTP